MDALREALHRVGFALVAVACGACVFLVALTGFAVWGEVRTRRTKREILHDPKSP